MDSFIDADVCAAALAERLDGDIRLAMPLGLGKPVRLANALYRLACNDPALKLSIFTALTLEPPQPQPGLERRLLEPIVARLYQDVPELDYARDLRRATLPDNVTIEEFYFKPGAWLRSDRQQQNYVSLNYTHAARDIASRHINVIAQMVAPSTSGQAGYSLSCNPDITLDLLDILRQENATIPFLVGEVNPALPYMQGDAELPASAFSMVIANDTTHYALFPVPNRFVPLPEQVIGLRVAALIADGGTLQIGIGSVGDAVAYAVAMRRQHNDRFRAIMSALDIDAPATCQDDLPKGLYGMSEMFVEGFLYLHRAGVLRRTVGDGIFLHAGFFLGSAGFYDRLRTLPDEVRRGINMTRISFTNSLLGDEAGKRQQRTNARFINTAMMVTLLGAAVSDALADGRVVSGVGGQHDFVTQGHQLAGARSIIVVPATREANGKVTSNIVWNYAHTTIPRHLRDIVVTEYGVADLRGATDEDVIIRLLAIADARFQDELRQQAVAAGKLRPDYRLPPMINTPAALTETIRRADLMDALPFYPIGSDLTRAEAELAIALPAMAQRQRDILALMRELRNGWRWCTDPRLQAALARIDLAQPQSIKDKVMRLLVASALRREVYDSGRPLFAEALDPAGLPG